MLGACPGLVGTLFARCLDFFEQQLCDVDGITGGTLARGGSRLDLAAREAFSDGGFCDF